jgi:hypothetical protein
MGRNFLTQNAANHRGQDFEKAETQIRRYFVLQNNTLHLRNDDKVMPVSRRAMCKQPLGVGPASLPSRMILVWFKFGLLRPDHDATFSGVTSIIGATPARAASSMIRANTSAVALIDPDASCSTTMRGSLMCIKPGASVAL